MLRATYSHTAIHSGVNEALLWSTKYSIAAIYTHSTLCFSGPGLSPSYKEQRKKKKKKKEEEEEENSTRDPMR